MSEAAKNTLQKVADELLTEGLADLSEGRTQALAILESSERESKEAVAKILETSVKQAESLRRQMLGAAEMESRNGQLRTLEEAVNEVFAAASKRLAKQTPAAQEESLSRLLSEGAETIGESAEVSCNAGDRKIVTSLVRKLGKGPVKLIVDGKAIQTVGGVVLTTAKGGVRFDNTYEARLERMRPTLRKEVAGILGGS